VDGVYERDHVTISIGKGRDGKEATQAGANLGWGVSTSRLR